MGLWHAYFSRTLVSSAGWSFFGSYSSHLRFLSAIPVSWSVSLFLSVLPAPPSLLFSLLFCLHGCKKLETRKCVLVVFLCPFPTALFPGWNCSFLQHSSVASCIFVLLSYPRARVAWAQGWGEGWWGGHSPFLRGSRSGPRTRPWETDTPTVTMGYTNITSI